MVAAGELCCLSDNSGYYFLLANIEKSSLVLAMLTLGTQEYALINYMVICDFVMQGLKLTFILFYDHLCI